MMIIKMTMIILFNLHMVFICKQKNLHFFIHFYINTLRSRTYYSRHLYQSLPVQKFWFSHSLLSRQNIKQVVLMHTFIVLFTTKFKVSLGKSKFPIAVIIKLSFPLYQLHPNLNLHNKLCTYLIVQQVTVDNVSLQDQNFT